MPGPWGYDVILLLDSSALPDVSGEIFKEIEFDILVDGTGIDASTLSGGPWSYDLDPYQFTPTYSGPWGYDVSLLTSDATGWDLIDPSATGTWDVSAYLYDDINPLEGWSWYKITDATGTFYSNPVNWSETIVTGSVDCLIEFNVLADGSGVVPWTDLGDTTGYVWEDIPDASGWYEYKVTDATGHIDSSAIFWPGPTAALPDVTGTIDTSAIFTIDTSGFSVTLVQGQILGAPYISFETTVSGTAVGALLPVEGIVDTSIDFSIDVVGQLHEVSGAVDVLLEFVNTISGSAASITVSNLTDAGVAKLLDAMTGIYVGLLIDGTEITGHGYTRVSITSAMTLTVDRSRTSDEDIIFPIPTDSWGTPNGVALYDGLSGERLTEITTLSITEILPGKRARIPAGELIFTIP